MKRRAFLKTLVGAVAAVAIDLNMARGPAVAHVFRPNIEPEPVRKVEGQHYAMPNITRKGLDRLNARRVKNGAETFSAHTVEELPPEFLREWTQRQGMIFVERFV